MKAVPTVNEEAFYSILEARDRFSRSGFKVPLCGAMTEGYLDQIRPILEFVKAPVLWSLTKTEPKYQRIIIYGIDFLLIPGRFPRMLITTTQDKEP